MNVAIWVAQVLLALTFLVSGGMKLLRPRLQLQAQLPYVEEFTDGQVKSIGGLEVLAAIGLILPSILRVAPVLTAAAAVGVVLLMIGAIATHARRDEVNPRLSVNFVLLALALVVAWARFGPYHL
ncbi:MAG TPA: DoxX family protein [Candidatus Dormibacteraeota bacterium]|nr:DoxX family protein [Candidatus Dormibacteraeota bacterium]